jgi:4-hydroxy-4-methyl-2-oxoglutarate aldolase
MESTDPRKRVSDDLIERYRSVPPATIGHVLNEGFMDTAIRPIFTPCKCVGRALTLKMVRGDSAGTRPAIRAIQANDVVIMARDGDNQVAAWGEMTSLAAKVRGAAGIIIDGAVTDVVEIEDQQVPTWASGISALVGRGLNLPGGGVNIPVSCGGVLVNPGDLVVADENGIVVMSPEVAERVYAAARASEDRAPFTRMWLEHGGELGELAGKTVADVEAMLKEKGWD